MRKKLNAHLSCLSTNDLQRMENINLDCIELCECVFSLSKLKESLDILTSSQLNHCKKWKHVFCKTSTVSILVSFRNSCRCLPLQSSCLTKHQLRSADIPHNTWQWIGVGPKLLIFLKVKLSTSVSVMPNFFLFHFPSALFAKRETRSESSYVYAKTNPAFTHIVGVNVEGHL